MVQNVNGMSITLMTTVVTTSIQRHETLRKRSRTSHKPKMKSRLPATPKSWFCRFSTPAHTRMISGPAVVVMPPSAEERKRKSTTSSIAYDSNSWRAVPKYTDALITSSSPPPPPPPPSSTPLMGVARGVSESSLTRTNDTGTISAEGTATMAHSTLNESPLSKLPWYSGPFMQRPTSSPAQMLPTVRTRYAVVWVRPRCA
mmetsp:Transcript_2192/g.5805  ORF Transcript_2192/g.5805 Transcript_2192/m.5805 type:complete len:201 (+) Transcript_2192:594-1196(+)